MHLNILDYCCTTTVNSIIDKNQSASISLSLNEIPDDISHEEPRFPDIIVASTLLEKIRNQSEGGLEGFKAGVYSCNRAVFHPRKMKMIGVSIWEIQYNITGEAYFFLSDRAISVALLAFLGIDLFAPLFTYHPPIQEFEVSELRIEKMNDHTHNKSSLIKIK